MDYRGTIAKPFLIIGDMKKSSDLNLTELYTKLAFLEMLEEGGWNISKMMTMTTTMRLTMTMTMRMTMTGTFLMGLEMRVL